ncbi:MAG: transglycosylase SLT domain-containing protein [Bdellovibrionota bacterium]
MKNKLKQFSQSILSALIIINMIFPSSVFAANIELDTAVNFRVEGIDSTETPTLKALTVMPKGTVLEVPDEFVIKTDNKVDINKTLNNWMIQSNIKQTRFDKRGRPSYEHFFPVKIVSMPDNKSMNGQHGFVALKHIAERGGLKLETTHKTNLVDSREFKIKNSKPSIYANGGRHETTEAKTCIADCDDENSLQKRIRADLQSELTKVKNHTNAMMRSKRIGGSFDAIARNFERTCFGLKFDDFANYVKEVAPKQNIPAEVMLGILTQESAGVCHAVGDKKSRSKSVGLFQLNTRTVTNVDSCTPQQLQSLKGKTIDQMASDSSLRCLQNPAVNLEGGMKVLLNKYSIVNNGAQPTSSSWATMSLTEKDNFRKALAAYNGGEGWVQISKSDIAFAKDKFDIALNNDWETVRLFMFRHKLRANGYVGKNKSRMTKWETSNVAYVDAILGRGTGEDSQKGFTDHWHAALRGSAISVASREI